MSPIIRVAIIATLCTALPMAVVRAQSPQPLSKEAVAVIVDSMVSAFMAAKGPASISIAISRGNETLVERAWGVTDVTTMRPATPNTVYKIGSVSKQFTAVLILKQVERGKLALSDSLGRYLSTNLRPEWRSLIIEQLLNHTSGLPNDLTREGRPEEEVSTEAMLAWAARDTMAFAPGTRMAYSNVGYLLLGALVETLYGKPYRDALQEEIAGPLGLTTLRWCTNPAQDTTVATGHQYVGTGNNTVSAYAHPSKSLGAGGLCSSAPDLGAWNRALHGGRVLSPDSYAAMIAPRGASNRYGFGLYVTSTAWGVPVIYHPGGIIGFSAANAWFPAESLSLTALYNSLGNGLPTNFALDIARAISTPVPPKSPTASVMRRR